MIQQIVSSGKSIAFLAAVATLVLAQVGSLSMSVHPVGFSFVAEETSGGGELLDLACAAAVLAHEGLEVRVDVFTVGGGVVSERSCKVDGREMSIRTHSCT